MVDFSFLGHFTKLHQGADDVYCAFGLMVG